MRAAIIMWPTRCLGLHLALLICLKITGAIGASEGNYLVKSLSNGPSPQSRAYNYGSLSSLSLTKQQAVAPFEYSSAGISRTLYPSYVGYPVYPSSSATGYSIPAGATSLGRSYSGYGDANQYSVYPSPYSSKNVASAAGSSNAITQSLSVVQPRSLSPYGQNYPYNQNSNFPAASSVNAVSYNSADPAEPQDPSDTDTSKNSQVTLSMMPRYNFPTGQGAVSYTSTTLGRNYQPSGYTGTGSDMTGQIPFAARDSYGGGTTATGNHGAGSGTAYGIGNNYAAAAPSGASYADPSTSGVTYTGPASSYAQATGYGKEGYAQSSPNTASGSVYNPSYGGSSAPSYYGAKPKNYGLGTFPATSFNPFYLYYPVQYGYDQGERTVMPNPGYFPLVGYKRRYGYRNGPYYGYGIYVDYPPYFGFGKVKDGWGSDPEADLMASVALEQGAGVSALQSVQSSSGNSATQQSGGYDGSSGYGNAAAGQTSGYGGSANYGGSYAAAASGAGYGSTGSSYPPTYSQGTPSGYSSAANSGNGYSQPPQQTYASPTSGTSYASAPASSYYSQPVNSPSGQYSQQSYAPGSTGNSYGQQQNYGSSYPTSGQNQYGSQSQYGSQGTYSGR